MKVRVIPGRELSSDLCSHWSRLQMNEPSTASPFFRPEFTKAVAAVRSDVFVGVVEESSRIVGFFPFQKNRVRVGRPVGGPLSDYHGIVGLHNKEMDAREVIASCGLAAWTFDHVAASQTLFRPFFRHTAESPVVNLASGFDNYTRCRKDDGSDVVRQCARKIRKCEREAGPIRFHLHTCDHNVLDFVVRQKSEQCRRRGVFDVFHFDWAKRLLTSVLEAESEDFAGLLSILYVGDRVAAAHMGLRSHATWHWWFPTYVQEFAPYSPGMILLMKMCESAGSIGVTAIDLGKGTESYKCRMMNDAIVVGEGTVECSPLVSVARRACEATRTLVRALPRRGWARPTGRLAYQAREWLRYR